MRSSRPLFFLLVGVVVAFALASAVSRPLRAQPTEDAALLRELAERLLSPGLTPFGPPPAPTTLLPGALPPLPFDLPQPAGARLLGSATRPAFTGTPARAVGESIDVLLDVPLAPRATVEFYEQTFTAQGWTVPRFGRGPFAGGFQPGPTGVTSTLCRSDSGPYVILTAGIRTAGMTEARLHIETSSATPGPCSAPAVGPPAPVPPPLTSLPTLQLPPNARWVGGGESGGSGSSSRMSVRLSTDDTIDSVMLFFGQQLLDQGWARLDGASTPAFGWSTWQPPMGSDWRAMLIIFGLPTMNQLQATLELARADEGGSSRASSSETIELR